MGSRYDDNGKNSKKKKSGGVGTFITTLLLVIAIGVFAFSGWKLFGYYMEYKAGTDEYSKLNDKFVTVIDNEKEPDATDTDSDTNSETAEDEEDAPVQEPVIYETESEIAQSGETVIRKMRKGKILKKVEDLEDPDETAVEEKVEKAAAIEAEENGKLSMLPMLVNPIDFDELKEINDEIIGWLRIGALDISYPVAQAKDNDFYLHRTFEKQDNFAGCIFLNCDNSRFFTDQNSIIYGHNMKNGSMFGKLRNIKDQETYDKNPYFWIFTPRFIYQYRIFSCAIVSKQGDPYRTRFTTEEYQSFIDTMNKHSEVNNHGLSVTTDDRITTLSTCTGDDSTRFIVQGKLQQVYISKKVEK